jgi:hsp70-interacting protein
VLLEVAKGDADDEARSKALLALSCLTRGCDDAQRAFSLGGGASACAKLIGYDGAERVRVKALTLGKHVFTQSEGNMASAVEFGAIANAAKCLESADVNCREAAARVLLDIARCVDFEKNPKAVDEFRNPDTIARIAKTRDVIAAMTDEDDANANVETKVALDALHAMFTN